MKHIFTLLAAILTTMASFSARAITADDLTGRIVGQVFFGSNAQDGLPVGSACGQFIQNGTNTYTLQGYMDSFDMPFIVKTIGGSEKLVMDIPTTGDAPYQLYLTNKEDNQQYVFFMTAYYGHTSGNYYYDGYKFLQQNNAWAANISYDTDADVTNIQLPFVNSMSGGLKVMEMQLDKDGAWPQPFMLQHFYCYPDNATMQKGTGSTTNPTWGEASSARILIDGNDLYFYNWNDIGWAYEITPDGGFEETGYTKGTINWDTFDVTIPRAKFGADVSEDDSWYYMGYGQVSTWESDADWFYVSRTGSTTTYHKYFQKNAQGGNITGKLTVTEEPSPLCLDHWASDCGGHLAMKPAIFTFTFGPWCVYEEYQKQVAGNNGVTQSYTGAKVITKGTIQEKAELANLNYSDYGVLSGDIVATDEGHIVDYYDLYAIPGTVSTISGHSSELEHNGQDGFTNADKLNDEPLHAGHFSFTTFEFMSHDWDADQNTQHAPSLRSANAIANDHFSFYLKVHYKEGVSMPDTYDGLTPLDLSAVPAGIDTAEWDMTQPVEYFDLQGRPLTSPATGYLMLERRGTSVRKVMAK